MSYFDSILNSRNIEECPLPLWRLKITDEEYKELRSTLEKRTHVISNEPFLNFRRECALFFAEFWRREYNSQFKRGGHSVQMVYDALNSTRKSANYSEDFYYQASKGANILGIEQYDGGRADPLNSMLYQGGLPMKLVTSNIANSIWDRFTRGLVNRHINFDELNLGLVASQNQSLKYYCEQLIVGIESGQYILMPYYCENEYDSWFVYLNELSKQERDNQRKLHPFSLDWKFRVDNRENIIYAKYVVKGNQKLPKEFLDNEGLSGNPFFSIQIRANDKVIDTFDYVNNFSRYAVVSKHPYHYQDNISLIINDNEEPHINGELDMTVPHILYRNNDGQYELGNYIGKRKSLLLIPKGWDVENADNYELLDYDWEDKKIQGIQLPEDHQEDVIVSGTDGTITFGVSSKMYWTELSSYPTYQPNIEEPLYDARKCLYKMSFDTEDGIKNVRNAQIQFRNKWQNNWSNVPTYGEIFVRAIDVNGHFVTPIRIINIGDELVVNLLSSDSKSCQIKMSWSHGKITSTEGVRKVNDVWEIRKEHCANRNKIRFTLVPNENSCNQFTISVKSPFKEFYILDIDGNPIKSDSWIPYSDLDKYQYHIVGQNIKNLIIGNRSKQVKWYNEKLYIEEDDQRKSIPYEGSLLTLLGKRDEIRAMLERTSKNMLNAAISVSITTSNNENITFEIKDSPFRPRQIADGKIVITSKGKNVIDFRGALKLLKLEDPTCDSIIMYHDEENGYILPEKIRDWGKTILIGRTRGRICPALVDLSMETDNDSRKTIRESAIATILENLRNSKLGDKQWERIIGWFNRVQKDDIPASSLLELFCVARNPEYLICLAFQLFAQCSNDDEQDIIKQQLKQISDDIGFQWHWICPYIDGIMMTIIKYVDEINNAVLRNIYIKWAVTKGAEMARYLAALNNEESFELNIGDCLNNVMQKFTLWLKDLCLDSLLDSYDSISNQLVISLAETIIKDRKHIYRAELDYTMYVETSQDYIDDNTGRFFMKYNEPGTLGNEQWMFKRVNALVDNLDKNINLFDESDEIRRSIIFCSKSCNCNFIVALNNKLANSKL
jgi:hypothetical protein